LPEEEEAKEGGGGGVPSLAEAMAREEGDGGSRAPAPVRLTLQAMAQRLAQRYNLDPNMVSQLVDELLEEASKDPELEEVLGAARYLDVIRQLGRGTVSERVQDIVSSRLVAKLGDRLVKRLDGDYQGVDPRMMKMLETISMWAALSRFAAQILGDDRPRGDEIAEAVARAVAQQQGQLAAALEKLGETFSKTVEAMNRRIEALEKAMQEALDRRREEATRRMIEEVTSRVAGPLQQQVESLSKALESLSKSLESVNERVSKLESAPPTGQGGFTSIADVIEQFVQQAEKLKRLGIEIVTPDKKIEELERKLRERLEKGEVSDERYEELLKELERLRRERESEERQMKMKMMEMEIKRKEEEIKAMRSFLENVGKAIYELVRNPSRLRELVGLVQGISGVARPGQGVEPQPAAPPPPANIPRLADILEEEESVGSGGAVEEAPTGEEGGVREEGAEGGGAGPGEGGEVQRPGVREEGAGAASGEEGGGEAVDKGGGEAGVQGRGDDG